MQRYTVLQYVQLLHKSGPDTRHILYCTIANAPRMSDNRFLCGNSAHFRDSVPYCSQCSVCIIIFFVKILNFKFSQLQVYKTGFVGDTFLSSSDYMYSRLTQTPKFSFRKCKFECMYFQQYKYNCIIFCASIFR